MAKKILEKVRKLNWVLQESSNGKFSFNDLCGILSDLMNANVYIANARGKVIGVRYTIEADSPVIEDSETGAERFPSEYNQAFLEVDTTVANLIGDEVLKIFKNDYDSCDKYHTVVPILGGGKRWGTIILARHESSFNDEDLVLAEYGATVVGIEIQRRKLIEAEEDARERAMVQMAIGTLSYSELNAVHQIFTELPNSEGLLVASRIADKSGITRSVIVNALRKLESAGVIESRSLGMKGTYIKIVNNKFRDELQKFIV